MIEFKLEKRPQGNLGLIIDTLVKYEPGKDPEEWCNVQDLDKLFDTCVKKWPKGWDFEKLLTCVRECDFE